MTSEFVEISTKLGKLKGLVKKSAGLSNTTYYSFQGIPYAKPPVGKLRFKSPEPFGKWEGIRDATKEGNDTAQKRLLSMDVFGSEDCLYLNVYTPQKPGKGDSKKPVMVWIHGGGFLGGSGSTEMYGPDYLVEKDIILVTTNYRCGALGFLSLENDKIPGNAGLKDQNLALRWVQENINSFGGDSKNVTIFGESAGAASVHYHILSPLSKGLFHKAILQSGSSLCQWALITNPKEKALLLAKELGCTSQDPDEVLEFLMSVPANEIVVAQHKEVMHSYKEIIQKTTLVFTPCVESAGREPFLSDYPRKLMERGDFNKVPVIIGVTDKEGLLMAIFKLIDFEKINADSTIVVPLDLKIKRGGEEERKLGKEILQFYTKKEALSWDDIHEYIDLLSDVAFDVAMESSRQSFLKHSNLPVYTYLFTFHSPRAISSMIIPVRYPDRAAQLLNSGACHGDDLVLNFKTNFVQAPFIALTDDEQVFMDKFSMTWTNFAKTCDPNSKEIEATWKPDNIKSQHFLEHGTVNKAVDGTVFEKLLEFWKKQDPNSKEIGATWKPDNIKSPHFLELGKVCKAVDGTVFPKRMEFWKKLYEKYSFAY